MNDVPHAPGSPRADEEAPAGLRGNLGWLVEELNSTLDLDAVLTRVAQQVRGEIDFDHFAILLIDDLGQELHFRFAVGYPEEITRNWRFGLGQGIVGTAARESRSVRVDDARSEPRYIRGVDGVLSELAVPLVVRGRTIGVLDVASRQPAHFTREAEDLLHTIAGPLANAIENARLYGNLRDHARTLSLLHELSRELTSILDKERLLTKVAQAVKRLIDYQLFSVMLWNERTQRLEHEFSMRYDERLVHKEAFPLGYGICGTAAALRQAIRVPNVHLDPRYVSWNHGIAVNSELVVPLLFEDRLVGVLDLESIEYNAFSEWHEQMLSTLASSIVIALENARLYERVREQERAVQEDIYTAGEIQRGLLPSVAPAVAGLELAFLTEPARQIGGDFYDFLPYDENRLAIAVGDAAGKGVSGALFGALSVGILRGQVVQTPAEPAEMLALLNEHLCQPRLDNRFLALCYLVYDARTRSVAMACAGFPRPYLVRQGIVEELPVEGLALGIFPGVAYSQRVVGLAPGDTLVITSDGVDDMGDPEGEPFGRARLREVLRGMPGWDARSIAREILSATNAHAEGGDPDDDRTVVVLRAIS